MALFVLCALCAMGCLSTGSEPSAPDGPGPSPDDTSGDGQTTKAYFVLQGGDLRGANWPAAFAEYSLMVCNPSLSATDVAQIRTDLPGCVLLAYFNVQDSPIGMFASPYYQAMEAVFDSTQCLIDLDTGKVVRQQGHDEGTPGSGYPHFIFNDGTIEALVAFHRDVTMAAGWDGFYLDQSTGFYPPWRRAMLLDQTPNFDFDADGVSDSIDKIQLRYPLGRYNFTRRLREELGDAKVIVANSGGPLGDSNLNGICLEGVGDRFTITQARDYVTNQEEVSRSPFTAVFWATTVASEAPSMQLATELGVHYGAIGGS